MRMHRETTRAEAEALGNICYTKIPIQDVEDLELLRKRFKVTPISLPEQIKNRKSFDRFKKTDEYKRLLMSLRKLEKTNQKTKVIEVYTK